MSIADNIKKIRKDNNMTQKQFAEKINKKEITIRRYEKGDIIPPISVIDTISDTFDIPVTNIIGDMPTDVMDQWVDKTTEKIKKEFPIKSAMALGISLEKLSSKPSTFNRNEEIRNEEDSKYNAFKNLVANEYFEKEYNYKWEELSINEIGDLYAFMCEMLQLKITEIKSRNK